jgi:hypothetical protein
MKSRMRGPIGASEKSASGFDWRMRCRTLRNRIQNPPAEATANTRNTTISTTEGRSINC